jgi:hypothetical protein
MRQEQGIAGCQRSLLIRKEVCFPNIMN